MLIPALTLARASFPPFPAAGYGGARAMGGASALSSFPLPVWHDMNGKGVVSESCCHPHRGFFLRRPSPPPLLFFLPASKSKAPIPSLRISNRQKAIGHVICLSGTNSAENYAPDDSTSSSKDAAFDTALPRRSLMVHFTCDACGERTRRLINRLAYERGTVFVQCAGCLVYHKFVDNLGLVVEYDLREELHGDSDGKAGTSNSES